MIEQDWLGFVVVLAFVFLVTTLLGPARLQPKVKLLVFTALILRIVGSQLYNLVFSSSRYGGGDYLLYFTRGVQYAERYGQGDFSMFFDSAGWWGGDWWGTEFIFYLAGFVSSLIGPTLHGLSLVFALLGFLGLVGFAVAFRRMYPHVPVHRYLVWIWLFPSLWFWAAVVGKEAVLLMGLGVAVWGYVGKRGRIQWPLLALGLFFVFAVRPQVAAVAVLSLALGTWFTTGGQWTVQRTVQSIVILLLGVGVIHFALQSIGAGGLNAQGAGSYIARRATTFDPGGSQVGAGGLGWRGAAIGFVNVLFRPFPWEVRNVTYLISSLEVWGFWLLFGVYRRNVLQTVRGWRADRLVAMSASFVLLYATTLGMTVGNLGIIARQRVFLFPFLFIFFVAVPPRAGEARPARAAGPQRIQSLARATP